MLTGHVRCGQTRQKMLFCCSVNIRRPHAWSLLRWTMFSNGLPCQSGKLFVRTDFPNTRKRPHLGSIFVPSSALRAYGARYAEGCRFQKYAPSIGQRPCVSCASHLSARNERFHGPRHVHARRIKRVNATWRLTSSDLSSFKMLRRVSVPDFRQTLLTCHHLLTSAQIRQQSTQHNKRRDVVMRVSREGVKVTLMRWARLRGMPQMR